MHLPTAFRPSRGGRLFTVAAIAAVVLLAPTAGAGGALGSTAPPGAPTGHDTGRSGQVAARAVEPVGNTAEPADDERNDDRDTAAEDRKAGRNDDRNAGRNDERGDVESTGTAEPENDASSAESAAAPAGGKNGDNNGLDVLGRDCSNSPLTPHDGFQGPGLRLTEFGEVAAADKGPSLLITEAPQQVGVGEPFTLKVSTRNLVRDRFLAAGPGGYYVESSCCRRRASSAVTSTPPAGCWQHRHGARPGPGPEFFVATEDNRGGADADRVTSRSRASPTEGPPVRLVGR